MKPVPQLRAPPTGSPASLITTNPGRFWSSLPRPYSTHEPRLGRPARIEPVFIWQTEPTWFSPSAQQDRTTARSSTTAGDVRQPVGHLDAAAAVLAEGVLAGQQIVAAGAHRRQDRAETVGSFCPCSRVNSGFGSKVSRWLGPPSMNRKMIAFAFGANRGKRSAASRPSCAAATPGPAHRNRRRL